MKITIALALISNMYFATAQYRVINQTNSIRLLQVRPYLQLGILPEYIGDLMVQTNVDAQYWVKDKMDITIALTAGSYTGIELGGTLHIKDRFINKKEKFKFSETTVNNKGDKVIELYVAKADVRKVSGPTLGIQTGQAGKGYNDKPGFYINFKGGLDFQTFSRNYIEVEESGGKNSYPANRNGWYSIKALGIVNYYTEQQNIGGGTNLTKVNYLDFGVMGSLNAVKSPWKSVSFNLRVDLGATFGKEGVTPIISPGFGLSINLIKSKKEIEY